MLRSPLPYIIWVPLLAWPATAPAQQPRGTRAAVPAVRLPAIPAQRGPLALRVVYPVLNQVVTARDSNFLFGTTGNGAASLTINGDSVAVAPNGAFLAWLPVTGDTAAVYHLVARLGGDSVMLDHRVRLPRRFTPPVDSLWLDRGSIEPRGTRWAEPGELIRVGVRAAPGSTVVLKLPDGTVVPLAPDTGSLSPAYGPFDRRPARTAEREVTRYAGFFPARAAIGAPLPPLVGQPFGVARLDPIPMVNVTQLADSADSAAVHRSDSALVMVVRGPDTVRAPLPFRLAMVDAQRRPVVVLDDDTARAGNTDGAVSGKPLPDGTFEWFFRNGTVAAVSGRAGDHLRLALSRLENVWVAASDVAGVLPDGTPPPYSRVALVRLTPGDSSVVARIAMSARLPYKIEETDRALTLRVYSARADLDWLQYGGTDPLVRRMSWAQPTEDEVTVTFELSRPVFGYRTMWQGSDLLLGLRRPPTIDRARPLRGRVIAVDPGHPPVGATGPTGFMEKDANLAVGLALRDLLVRAGARVIMTRTIDTAIGLYERTNLAEAANAEILVSIHNNAFPDGVNPFENNGTSAYYFQPRSSRLAFLVQDAMVRQMGLRNLGIGRGDLALVRPTWMPAVLAEGAFMMIPEQENALKTPSFQQRYARGVMQGIEAYFRELASTASP